ncbi:MAG: alpha/beta hydrolase [Acidovorax sp.]|uniref:alpha/beta hydrolase n=1 Tax=Acidovorax sp. TaxID=1872122 RepID=UPI0039E644CE
MKALWVLAALLAFWTHAQAQVVEIPTRPGVTQRVLSLKAADPKATLILFPGGHGGLQFLPNGSMKWGGGNFLVRTRQAFLDQGFNVVIVDAPSDRQAPPFLQGFRQRPEHAADVKAVIAWARESAKAPVWLVGTSRGTQSVGYVATELTDAEGPDGIVLTSSITADDKGRPVPAMPLGKIKVPVLVVHHEQDGCSLCPFAAAAQMMEQFKNSSRKQLLAIHGGSSSGDECEARAHHGFNGVESDVIQQIAAWILAK